MQNTREMESLESLILFLKVNERNVKIYLGSEISCYGTDMHLGWAEQFNTLGLMALCGRLVFSQISISVDEI